MSHRVVDSLSPLAGSRLTRKRCSIGSWLLIAWSLGGCTEPSTTPLNVVLITLDTFRADALGVYGNPEGLSPHIDAFASEATIFENAVTAIGTTFPSHATIFTGLYPKNHGVRWNGDSLDRRWTTLAEILSAEGYETAAFVSVGSLLSRGGLDQGFSSFSDSREAPPAQHTRSGYAVNEMVLSWLAERSDVPFFLWLHYFETHTPYRLSPHARKRHEDADYHGIFARGATAEMLHGLDPEFSWSPAEKSALRALYDGAIIEVDRLVGEILGTLRARNLMETTAVFLTADHGESLGEHNEVGHGFLLWQPVIHVPLIVRVPGARPRRVATRVSLVDLSPTILDLLGLAAPPELDGRSLISGIVGEQLPPHRYFAEVRAIGSHSFRTVPNADRFAVFDGNLKAMWDSDHLLVLDLEHDPQELRPEDTRAAEGKRRELFRYLATYREGAVEPARQELTDAVKKELQSLGYLP